MTHTKINAFTINQSGICTQANFVASPNFDARPIAHDICLIVIHNISLPPQQYGGPGVQQLFTNCLDPNEHPYYAEIAHLKVSSHFFVQRDGKLLQFVSCKDRAWHAGVSDWQGRTRCNDFSIGIELEGSDYDAFEPNQYAVLKKLVSAIKQRYHIQAVTGHSDIAPNRKTDPGPFFDWAQLSSPE